MDYEKKRISNPFDSWSVFWLSILCLLFSIAALLFVFFILRWNSLALVCILTSLGAIFAPIGCKKLRLQNGKSGKGLEIAAVIIGGLAFYLAIMFMGSLPIFIGYLGWAAGTAIYRTVQ